MKRINIAAGILIMGFSMLVFHACKKDKEIEPTDTDTMLYELSKSAEGFTWYKNSDALLASSSGTGHSQPQLRTRYNSIAAQQLDENGKVKPGARFDEESLIVKELVNSGGLDLLAILYKKTDHPDADENGWVWGYINPNGTVRIPAGNKGAQCISCHSQPENIDYMLMNKFFP